MQEKTTQIEHQRKMKVLILLYLIYRFVYAYHTVTVLFFTLYLIYCLNLLGS